MTEKKILVVEDDSITMKMICKTLSDVGYEYMQAPTGETALEIARNNDLKAILLDWVLPNMMGDEVLEKLKQRPETKSVPIIMLTSKNEVSEVSKILEKGATDYVVKPYDTENLIMRLKNAINKSH